MSVVAKRSSMTFFSDPKDHYCHRVRIVLAEKGVAVDVLEVDPENPPVEIADMNPYNELPTLVDRDLVLYHQMIMMEYLDERFPHPPLLPVYPVARAQSRLWISRVQRDWCGFLDVLVSSQSTEEEKTNARNRLRDSVISISPIFDGKAFFMSDEFSLVDCCIAPILWRMSFLGIEVSSRQAKPLVNYANKLFDRAAFQESLSSYEKGIAPDFFS